jgi:hypothetical protein
MRAVATVNPGSTVIAIFAAALAMLPVTGAQAQWYSSYPQAPYGGSPEWPYAVQVAPNTYVIHRPDNKTAHVEPAVSDRPRTHANRELTAELAKRNNKRTNKRKGIEIVTVNTTKTVRSNPVVVEHQRVVDDPPRVIERRHITEDGPGRGIIKQRREVATEDVVIEPGGPRRAAGRSEARHSETNRHAKDKTTAARDSGAKRVIRAEAEVTILGPDRMSIRLFRKGRDANAEVVE